MKLFDGKINEHQFWEWFQLNEDAFYTLESSKDPLLNELHEVLTSYYEGLTYQFSIKSPEGKKEFVISADGIAEAFPAVETLVDAAPEFDRWQIIAFRPRVSEEFELSMGSRVFTFDDFYFLHAMDVATIALQLHIRDFEDTPEYQQAAFIILDNILGEYDMETKVGHIEFLKLDEAKINDLYNIRDLPVVVDDLFRQINN